jgi:hypothetical protein
LVQRSIHALEALHPTAEALSSGLSGGCFSSS